MIAHPSDFIVRATQVMLFTPWLYPLQLFLVVIGNASPFLLLERRL